MFIHDANSQPSPACLAWKPPKPSGDPQELRTPENSESGVSPGAQNPQGAPKNSALQSSAAPHPPAFALNCQPPSLLSTARDPLHKIKIIATFKFPCPHLFQGGSHSPQTPKQMLQGTVPRVSSQCHSCRCSTNLGIQSMAAPCPLLPPLCRSR